MSRRLLLLVTLTATVALLSAVPVAADDRPVRTDRWEWRGDGVPPATAELDVCRAEAETAMAGEGGWQYRMGRSLRTAGSRRSAAKYRVADCAVVIATHDLRSGDGWSVEWMLVWVSTNPFDRGADELVFGRVPGLVDPPEPVATAPQLITVSDCAGWNRHPLPVAAVHLHGFTHSHAYTGSGRLYLDRQSVDSLTFTFSNGRPAPNGIVVPVPGGSWLQVGNVRYETPILQDFRLVNRPQGIVVGDTYAYSKGDPGYAWVNFNVASC